MFDSNVLWDVPIPFPAYFDTVIEFREAHAKNLGACFMLGFGKRGQVYIRQCGCFRCTDLKSIFSQKNPAICASVSNNLSEAENVKLAYPRLPVFALDNPGNFEAGVSRFHENINIVTCTNPPDCDVRGRFESERPKEFSGFLLILAPICRHGRLLLVENERETGVRSETLYA
ncbi:hypothetical protein FHW18_000277 [Pigmentiphaga litoralis]|uniref:Uncharacterized protein n=1 Tax=Pigmentiphaga litoralis TaxID=516702 RepID=A0A7Y9IQF0_9BURK|nr:hypothetical protein [Pigmentiphaga litoralis]NYE25382.1 hypothetical protein [Pigmentiphaga litoralis]NYE81006.1 hypothetical protein [Pigmentiphaga litoralis]